MTDYMRSEVEKEAPKVECRGCGKMFYLTGDDEIEGFCSFLRIQACESGGIYGMYLVCPHCRLKHTIV